MNDLFFNKLELDLSDKFHVSRDKSESKQSRKRSLNQCNENPERREAVKYLNKTGSRRGALLKYVTQDEASNKRKKVDSLQCKKTTSLDRKKSNQTSVSRPVAAGISQ